MPEETSDLAEVRLQKLQQIEALGLDPWGQRFDNAQPIEQVIALPADLPEDQRPRVRIAGRITSRRSKGKLHFLDISDASGHPVTRRTKGDQSGKYEATEYIGLSSTVQVMIGQNQVGETGWALAQLFDLGDLIGVEGVFGKTRMGELTIFADKLTFLTKSLEPHPDKWAGMQDIEFVLRHRYLDLTYNPLTLDRAKKRVKIIRTIRTHLDAQGYMEVETPTLHAIAGGAAARPFETHHNALDIDLFVRIALELPLKRLLVGGIEKVYELGRVFRNEGISPRHNPEFTMLELYQAYGDYRSMMDLTEGLIVACVDILGGGRTIPFGEKTVNFEPPFQRAKYADLFREHVGCDMTDEVAVRAAARAENIELEMAPTKGAPKVAKAHVVLVQELFEDLVEEKLVGPVFVYDYPSPLCPLTKRKRENPAIAERFELYVHGMELANAYTELNDPITQEQTFTQQLAGLSDEDSMAKMDHDFIRALRHGMPPAGGLGIGIDRLVMLLTNTQTIRDVILFPLLRPEAK
ncbi:lysyl-trna synthetase : Lysine--tRNA ligase OS=Pirellula staleyi (strain ATCC 27377 / DSM 6068 / ICPB 4128) GN=lysS PE=3 SV=1: tRNA_anti-codon: tRNA-synt_2 [Gemmata massiliana]|uniref:Lysine--tRNA ligase n=1 Tax=Gemmata massiliana TaxID=1210884 RepID=A0A6P2D8D0_9BACT|nr:lysine--tRNA ligase [Gemmata massiliana]VTR97429.1 lysyl-trna synthetase : Lysine--tRNA ligase OS=Pirellula staleyi (strain ATCC 27377 / DSM 6068 / ICPB 4128) GN=lysS PE=3 SV=1: tRNA_anti-codon: tRNA-synt_2 [Gemmata massiliana]